MIEMLRAFPLKLGKFSIEREDSYYIYAQEGVLVFVCFYLFLLFLAIQFKESCVNMARKPSGEKRNLSLLQRCCKGSSGSRETERPHIQHQEVKSIYASFLSCGQRT